MRIGVDVDEVLVEHLKYFLRHYERVTGQHHTVDDFHTYQWHEVLQRPKPYVDDIFYRFIRFHMRQHGQLPREYIRGAREAMQTLREDGHQLVLVTARPPELFADSDQIASELMADAVAFCQASSPRKSKARLCRELGIELMVDDDAGLCRDLAGSEVEVLLMDQPWNRSCAPRQPRVGDWHQAVDAIAQSASSREVQLR